MNLTAFAESNARAEFGPETERCTAMNYDTWLSTDTVGDEHAAEARARDRAEEEAREERWHHFMAEAREFAEREGDWSSVISAIACAMRRSDEAQKLV